MSLASLASLARNLEICLVSRKTSKMQEIAHYNTITQCSEIQKESENFEMRGFPQKNSKSTIFGKKIWMEQTFVKMKKEMLLKKLV